MKKWIALAISLLPVVAGADTFRKSGSGYYVDKDGGLTRTTDGTEPFVDFNLVEVPGDYSSIQNAIDSNDIKKGDTANQGGTIFVSAGTYTESFEIGGSVSADFQNAVKVMGAGPGGLENGSGTNTCATTLLGNNTASNVVIKVAGANGWEVRDMCLDMDDAATNDPSIGIHIGYATNDKAKHGLVENVTIKGGTSSTIGVKIGNDTTSSDTPFNELNNLHIDSVGLGILINSQQAIENYIRNLECSDPTGSIGCVSVGTAGGGAFIQGMYMNPGASGQVGINIKNEALGITRIEDLVSEWDQSNGTMIKFDSTSGTIAGAPHSFVIENARLQPQVAGATPVCIDWDRVGVLRISNSDFESGDATATCSVRLNNPSASQPSTVIWDSNVVEWNHVQSAITVNRTTAGGVLRVISISKDGVIQCDGAGTGITIGSTGCRAVGFVAAGTASMPTSAITSGSCASVVTVSATGVTTASVIQATPTADLSAVTGYTPAASVSIYVYPTTDNVNFKVCNPTASSITPSAATMNWSAR